MNRTYKIYTHQDFMLNCTNIYLVCEQDYGDTIKRFALNIQGRWVSITRDIDCTPTAVLTHLDFVIHGRDLLVRKMEEFRKSVRMCEAGKETIIENDLVEIYDKEEIEIQNRKDACKEFGSLRKLILEVEKE